MGEFLSDCLMNNMDKWCMKWNEFDTNIREYLRIIREDKRMFDVTLVTDDGQNIQAHKLILSAGSHFFSDIFLKSNQTNMLIYLKGINNVQLKYLLDFIYNGEASIGQEELKEFLETGKELQVKGFEAYVAGVGESLEKDPVSNLNEKEDIYEERDSIIEDNIICDTSKPSTEVVLKQTDKVKTQLNTNSELDLQLLEMIEKSDGVWICKVCGKTRPLKGDILRHAETHIKECPMIVISVAKVTPIDIVYVFIYKIFTQNSHPVIFVESQV